MAMLKVSQKGSASFKINDAVHGHMRFDEPLIKRIIDTPELQRLRHLKQIYSSSYVYPSANHTRFEHSLGVCHLAGKMIESLVANTPGLVIEDKEKLCVMIAALCHDMGHGPMSHSWEKLVHECGDTDWKHEASATDLLEQMLSTIEHDLKDDEKQLIKDIILGESRDRTDQYLFEIVNNQFCDMDVDKWDYLLRDSMQTNIPSGFDYNRLLAGAKVTEHSDGKKHITYRDSDDLTIMKMYMERTNLHNFVYQHRAAVVIEAMLLDALRIAQSDRKFKVNLDNGESYELSKAHNNTAAFVQLTDSVLERALFNGPSDAKKLIVRVQTRDLYKIVYIKNLTNNRQLERFNNGENLTKKLWKSLNEHGQGVIFTILQRKIEMGNDGKPTKTLFHDKQGEIVNKKLILFKQSGDLETYWFGELYVCVKHKVDASLMETLRAQVKEIVDKVIDKE